jgi:hypothetical protein
MVLPAADAAGGGASLEWRGPASALVLVLELTHHLDAVRVPIMHTLMRMGRDAGRLKVIDEHGELIGEIQAARAIRTAEAHRPLEIATARDFAGESRDGMPTDGSRG